MGFNSAFKGLKTGSSRNCKQIAYLFLFPLLVFGCVRWSDAVRMRHLSYEINCSVPMYTKHGNCTQSWCLQTVNTICVTKCCILG